MKIGLKSNKEAVISMSNKEIFLNESIISLVEKQKSKIYELLPQTEEQVDFTGNRLSIILTPGEQHIATNLAEEALLRNNKEVFQRSGELVRVVQVMTTPKCEQNYIQRSNEALIIVKVDSIYLTELLGIVADWKKYDARSRGMKSIDCPHMIAKTLLSRKSWELPVLSGIIQASTLRSDGSILEFPGYDKETGLFFNPSGTNFSKLSEFPTFEEAKESLNVLLNLVKDFPFEDDASESVAISAILTGLIRKSIRTAPLHGFSAPKMGSGKSLLADVVGLVATGSPNSVISQAENEAEEKKRLLAVLLEGDSIICFDNIERPFGSAALCSILTQSEYKDRFLGESKNIKVLTAATFLATGNNLTFVGDMSTRALLCRIDPCDEHPEEREFSIDLRKYIPKHRGEIVNAALTILRAYHVAGRPKQNIKPFGRFEEWSAWVRSALIWLGMEDPCNSRKSIESTDPIRLSLGNLMAAWYDLLGDMSFKTKDIIKRACEEKSEKHEALKDALIDFSIDSKGNLNEKKLGNQLSSFKNRIESGFRLESTGKTQGYTLWRVKKL